MKYLVLKTCHAGGRMCREGQIVDVDLGKDAKGKKIVNKYLEPYKGKKVEKKAEGQSLSDLAPKGKIDTGMAAKKDEEPKSQDTEKEAEPIADAQPEADDGKSEGVKEEGK